MVALVVELLGASSLAFALGMYIPIEYNSPILPGAIVAHFVRASAKDPTSCRARGDRGILVSRGLIAGGALAGVMAALVPFLASDVLAASRGLPAQAHRLHRRRWAELARPVHVPPDRCLHLLGLVPRQACGRRSEPADADGVRNQPAEPFDEPHASARLRACSAIHNVRRRSRALLQARSQALSSSSLVQ
jgi:hypothetical protein